MTAAWFGIGLGCWSVLLGSLLLLRRRDQQRRDGWRHPVRLHFPKDLDAAAVADFTRTLVALGGRRSPLRGRPTLVFEIAARAGGIEFLLRLPAGLRRELRAQLRTAVPQVVIEELKATPEVSLRAAVELALTNDRRPLRTDQPEAVAAAVLAALTARRDEETLVVQWVVGATPPLAPEPRPGRSPEKEPGSFRAALERAEQDRLSVREWREKTAEPLLGVSLRIGADAGTGDRARSLVRRTQGVLDVVSRPGARFRPRRLPTALVLWRLRRAASPVGSFPIKLNAGELAVLLSWPVGRPIVSGLATVDRRLLAPVDAMPVRGRVLGDSAVPGVKRALAISAGDSLRHMHLLGPTGVGKTSLMAGLAVQDLEAGRGVVIIDPKGDLARAVLDRVPEQRRSDLVVLDPSDESRPVGLNLLQDAHQAPERVADLVVGLFHRLFAASWGPRTADVLYASVLTLAAVPGMTLVELPVLLVNETFRRRLVGRLNDPVALEPFWAWYEALSPAERAGVIGPVMNKLRAFLLRRRLRLVLGQAEPAWRFEDVLNHGKVLVVPLNQGEMGVEAASLLGALVLARLWQAIQRRAVRLPAFVYIDEAHSVMHLPTDLADVLAQARGFGVGLHLAHQHLGALEPRMRAALLANARSRVVFQSGADDAGVLARTLGGDLTPADLMALPAYEAYASLVAAGAVTPPASLRTRPLPAASGSARLVRAASRDRYGQDREAVEAAIATRHGRGQEPDDAQLGRRRRAS